MIKYRNVLDLCVLETIRGAVLNTLIIQISLTEVIDVLLNGS